MWQPDPARVEQNIQRYLNEQAKLKAKEAKRQEPIKLAEKSLDKIELMNKRISTLESENAGLKTQILALEQQNLAMFNATMVAINSSRTSSEVKAQKYHNGTYVGEFINGARLGENLHGTFVFNDGTFYEGTWVDDQFFNGTLKDSRGALVDSFKNGERS